MKFNDKVYDILKWVAQLVLPALGTLYFALATIWNLPYATQVVGSLTALDTFLGVVLGVSTSSYLKEGADGTLVIDKSDETTDKYTFDVGDLDILEKKDKLMIKVDKTQ